MNRVKSIKMRKGHAVVKYARVPMPDGCAHLSNKQLEDLRVRRESLVAKMIKERASIFGPKDIWILPNDIGLLVWYSSEPYHYRRHRKSKSVNVAKMLARKGAKDVIKGIVEYFDKMGRASAHVLPLRIARGLR